MGKSILKLTVSLTQQLACTISLLAPLFCLNLATVYYFQAPRAQASQKKDASNRTPSSIDAQKISLENAIYEVDCNEMLKNRKKKPQRVKTPSNMARFILTNCPSSTKVINLSNRGRSDLFYQNERTLVSDFMSLTTGRNKIEFHVNRRVHTFFIQRHRNEFKDQKRSSH